MKEALSTNCRKYVNPDGLKFFNNQLKIAEKILPKKCHECDIDFNSYDLGDTTEEISYRKWCLKNRLFLNPLNDLNNFTNAAKDSIIIPPIVTPIHRNPSEIGIFNQIKQEYVSARFLTYEGVIKKELHFSDKEVLLVNTLDYPAYGLSIEKVKIAFRSFYSIFDHIAYLLNIYFSLGVNEREISFPRIWYKKGHKNNGIHEILKNSENVPLRGLYWISKDIFEDKAGFRDLVNPQAREIHKIRQLLEHRYLKVVTEDIVMNHTSDLFFDKKAFYISRIDFEQKTLSLAKLVRESIIYLTLAIYVEEFFREKKKTNKRKALPMIVDYYNDNLKI